MTENLILRRIDALRERDPGALAIDDGSHALTRAELHDYALELAMRLRAAGVRRGDFVVVSLQPGAEFMVSALATVLAGGAYVPVDPAETPARLGHLATTIAPRAWIGDRRGIAGRPELEGVASLEPPVLAGAPRVSEAARAELSDVARSISNEDAVYVVFTSGTTGAPKGVVVSHGALANLLDWQQDVFGLRPDDRMLQRSKLTFDFSVTELWLTLAYGGAAVVCPDALRTDVRTFGPFIREHGVTIAQFVPTVLSAWLAHLADNPAPVPATLRAVACNGEALSDTTRRQFVRRFPSVALFNQYGPAEATVAVTSLECSRLDEPLAMTVGRPAPGNEVHVLDAELRPVAPGQEGELCLSGSQLAIGYLGGSATEDAKFLVVEHLGRIYRTGDVGRVLASGEVDVVGRIDEQVKFRGVRLELGAIASQIESMPEVDRAIVRKHVALGANGRERQILVAVVSPETVDGRAVKRWCREHLVAQAVPGLVLPVPSLRFTPNGKFDLAAHLAAAERRDAPVAPRGPVESVILDVLEGQFGIEGSWATPTAELDSLGLDSLDRICIAEALAARRMEVPIEVLGQPGVTIEQVAAACRDASPTTGPTRSIPDVEEVADALRSVVLGAVDADVVVLHASLPDLVRSRDLDKLRAALVTTIRDLADLGITVAVPAFTPSFASSRTFHHRTSVSESGRLATWLQDDMAESLRTSEPAYSYQVAGPRGAELPGDPGADPFGTGSAAAWFDDRNALVVGLGTSGFTQTHRVEYLAGAPHHAQRTMVAGQADYGAGPLDVTAGLYRRDVDYYGTGAVFAQDVDRTRELLGSTMSARPIGRGGASVFSVRALDLRDRLLPILHADPMALLADPAGAARALHGGRS